MATGNLIPFFKNLWKVSHGHEDELTELLSEPEEITFEFELIEVEKNENHERDVWAMDKTEQTKNAPIYKEQGNGFFKQVFSLMPSRNYNY